MAEKFRTILPVRIADDAFVVRGVKTERKIFNVEWGRTQVEFVVCR